MKFAFSFFPLAGCIFLAGCAQQATQAPTPPAPVSAPVQPAALTPEQELAKYCRVCVVDNGEKMEEYLPTRLDTKHGGKTYRFCRDECQKKFTANRAKYTIK